MLWRKVIGYWKSILVLSAIAYLSLLREPSISLPYVIGMDKWIHAIMYLVLTLTLLWDSQQRPKLWWIVGVFSAIFGGFIEVLQEQFFYPRTGDWMDWLADCIGVIVAIIVWLIGVKWYEKRMVK
jgi:VanZ family protein